MKNQRISSEILLSEKFLQLNSSLLKTLNLPIMLTFAHCRDDLSAYIRRVQISVPCLILVQILGLTVQFLARYFKMLFLKFYRP